MGAPAHGTLPQKSMLFGGDLPCSRLCFYETSCMDFGREEGNVYVFVLRLETTLQLRRYLMLLLHGIIS